MQRPSKMILNLMEDHGFHDNVIGLIGFKQKGWNNIKIVEQTRRCAQSILIVAIAKTYQLKPSTPEANNLPASISYQTL